MEKEAKIIKNIIKISDLIFKEELNKYLLELKEYDFTKDENINIALLIDALEALKLSVECIEKKQISNGISLVRIAFEDLCFACVYESNNEKFKEAFFDINYKEKLQKAKDIYSIEKAKKLDAEKPQDYLSPQYVRGQVYKNEKVYFYETENIRLKRDGERLYDDLCIRTHPSIVRCFLYKFQNTINEMNILNYYKFLYCYIILLLIINHIHKINNIGEKTVKELEELLAYNSMCVIMNLEESKEFEKDAYNIIEMLKLDIEIYSNEKNDNFESPFDKFKNIDDLAAILFVDIIVAEELKIDLAEIKKELGIKGEIKNK